MGRLIDADDLEKQLCGLWASSPDKDKRMLELFAKCLREAPTMAVQCKDCAYSALWQEIRGRRIGECTLGCFPKVGEFDCCQIGKLGKPMESVPMWAFHTYYRHSKPAYEEVLEKYWADNGYCVNYEEE